MYQGNCQDNVKPEAPVVHQEMPARRAPQQHPPQRRRPPQRRKRTTTGTLLFYSIYVVMVLALFIAIAIAMGALKKWVPTVLPEDKTEKLSQQMFDKYFSSPNWAKPYKDSFPNATEEEVAK